jgi:hypothetical protein
MNCQMPFRDFLKGDEVVLDDSEVTARVKALFECKDKQEEKKNDPDFKVMVDRLKAAKIPIPRGATKEKVKELFDTFLVKGALAQNISGEAPAGEQASDKQKDEGDGGKAAPAEVADAPADFGEGKGKK